MSNPLRNIFSKQLHEVITIGIVKRFAAIFALALGWIAFSQYANVSTNTNLAPQPQRTAGPQSAGWTQQTSGTGNSLFSVHFVDSNEGWAVGFANTILHTTNGGVNWSPQTNQSGAIVSSYLGVRFLDSSIGWAGGASEVVRTTDGGASWTPQGATQDGRFRNNLFAVSSTAAWIPARTSTLTARWFSRFTVGVGEQNFNVLGGSSEYFDIYFTDIDNGWSVGTGPIVRITNGSSASPSFSFQTSCPCPNLNGIHMLDSITGWAVGNVGLILKTTDGGSTWPAQTSGTTTNLRSVHFVDANTGWAVGNGGLILASTDGGTSWNQETSGVTTDLRRVFFVNANTGYVVGHNGTILKRTNAPQPMTFVVTNTNDSGAGSLRQAIADADANTEDDTIIFNIPTSDPNFDGSTFSIRPTTGEYTLTDAGTFIDGASQAAFTGNTNASGPEIVIDGIACPTSDCDGFQVQSSNNRIHSLVINQMFGSGIKFEAGAIGNTITGCYIGTNPSGTASSIFFDGDGIASAGGNIIGGVNPGDGNLISSCGTGSSFGGLVLGSNDQVRGNKIGTNAAGTESIPNSSNGIKVAGSNVVIENNLISGGTGVGIFLTGAGTTSNTIRGNKIGTDITGTADVGNLSDGIWIDGATDNTIGGLAAADRNIISGNNQNGISISGSTATGNLVQGNYIGTDVTGTVALRNNGIGVRIILNAPGNTIGGTTASARNIISGNSETGIAISSNATGNVVQGNYIGTDVTGAADLGNGTGVGVFGSNNTIGGTAPGAGNLISGNHLGMETNSGTGNLIQGNLIGTNAAGTAALSNTLAGIVCFGSNNIIGGTVAGARNIIAFNGGDGVFVGSGTGNSIRGNSIHSNTQLGIDLGADGITANDADDGDSGANNVQNFPVITGVTAGTTNTINGTLNTTPNSTSGYTIDFFSNTACDGPLNGEGKTYLGSVVTGNTDANGNVGFSFNPVTLNVGDVVTATATDANGNTSEFSVCFTVVAVDVSVAVTPPAVDEDGVPNLIYTFTRTVTSGSLTVNFSVGGTASSSSDYTQTGAASFTPPTGTVTFGAGNSTAMVTVDPTADSDLEPDETVILTVTSGSGYNVAAAPNDSATGRITNDECAPPPAGMVAWYPGDGNALDIQGPTFENGTLQNGATFASGKVYQAFSLNGTNQYVNVANAAALPATFTFDAWVNPTSLTSAPMVYSKDDGFASGHYFQIESDGKLVGSVRNTSGLFTQYRTNNSAVVAGRFQHIAMTYDGSAGADQKMTFYVDGVNYPAAHLSTYDSGGAPLSGSGAARIGIYMDGTLPFDGLIDEFEQFNSVLSGAEITAIYNSGSAGKCRTCTTPPTGMIDWWPAEGNANDIAGTNNGTLQNGATFGAGKVGQAFEFNGADDYVAIAPNTFDGLTDLTVDAWVRFDRLDHPTSDGQSIISALHGGVAHYYTLMKLDTGELFLGLNTGGFGACEFTATPPVPFETGRFYHIAAIKSGSTIKLYVDGTEIFSQSQGCAAGAIGSNGGSTRIGAADGASPSDPDRELDGAVDELEIFSRALSQPEIAAIANAGNAGKCHTSTVTVAVSPSSVAEDSATNLVYTFTRSGDITSSLTANFSVGGTANSSNDYTQTGAAFTPPTGTVTFNAGASTAIVTIDPTMDTTDEPDETVILTVTAGTGYTVGTPDSATGTITDDDSLPNVNISDVSQFEGNSGTTAFNFTVTLSNPSQGTITVDFATQNDSAAQPGDYTLNTGTLNFVPGDTQETITVLVNGDTSFEPDETFFVNLMNNSSNSILAANTKGTGTITNDDSAPTFAIDDVTHNEGDAGTTSYTFTVTKTGSTGLDSSVNFMTMDGSATTANNDYQTNSGTLNFLATDTTKQITVLVNGDTTFEPDETFTVHLSGASNATISDADGTGAIINDDCGFSLSNENQNFSALGGTNSVDVLTGTGCMWTAVSNDAFITVNSGTPGSGNGTVNYSVAANTGPARMGTMTVAGITFTVTQDSGCMFTLSRDHQSFAGNGGPGSVDVITSDSACQWTASTAATFIQITSGTPGTGNGTLQYTVDANPGPAIRNATITIGDQTFTVYQGIDFLDVPQSNPFYNEIGKLSARGVTLGCGSGNYCPDDEVLRDQMAAFIMRAKGEFNPPTPGSQRFVDVPPENVFYKFIDRLAELQITLGCSPTMYCPSDAVKREQMAAFIIRGLGEFNPPTPDSQRFTDVPPDNPFYKFIDRMAVLQITLGCSPTMYCPNDIVTRASMAAFLVRAFNL